MQTVPIPPPTPHARSHRTIPQRSPRQLHTLRHQKHIRLPPQPTAHISHTSTTITSAQRPQNLFNLRKITFSTRKHKLQLPIHPAARHQPAQHADIQPTFLVQSTLSNPARQHTQRPTIRANRVRMLTRHRRARTQLRRNTQQITSNPPPPPTPSPFFHSITPHHKPTADTQSGRLDRDVHPKFITNTIRQFADRIEQHRLAASQHKMMHAARHNTPALINQLINTTTNPTRLPTRVRRITPHTTQIAPAQPNKPTRNTNQLPLTLHTHKRLRHRPPIPPSPPFPISPLLPFTSPSISCGSPITPPNRFSIASPASFFSLITRPPPRISSDQQPRPRGTHAHESRKNHNDRTLARRPTRHSTTPSSNNQHQTKHPSR